MRSAEAKRRGFLTVYAVIVATMCGVLIIASLSALTSQSTTQIVWDKRHQMSAEKSALGNICKEAALAFMEVQPSPAAQTPANIASEMTARLAALNAANAGVTFAVTSSPPDFPTNSFWPSAIPATRTKLSAEYETVAAGMGGAPMPYCGSASGLNFWWQSPAAEARTWTIDRIVNGANQRTYTVTAYPARTALTNFSIGYSCPSLARVATSAPTAGFGAGTSFIVAADGTNGVMLTQTTQNTATDTKVNAANHLRTNQAQDRLAYSNREMVSLCWTAWDYIWSYTYQDTIATNSAANGRACNIGAWPTPAAGVAIADNGGAGTWYDPTTGMFDLDVGTIQGTVSIYDGGGIARIRLRRGLNQTTPIVIQILGGNTGASQTVLEFTQSLNRPVIIMARNCKIRSTGVSMKGALWLDPDCTGDTMVVGGLSTLDIYGTYAFCAATRPAGFRPTLHDGSAATMSAIADISPQQTIIATQTTND